MTVPISFAALWLIAGGAALWIFYVAWRDAYHIEDEYAWVDEAVDIDDPVVQRVTRAVLEDAEVAALDGIWEMDSYGGARP